MFGESKGMTDKTLPSQVWHWIANLEHIYESKGYPIPYNNHDKLLSKLKGIEMFWKNADKTKSQYFEFDEFYEIVQDKLDKHMIEESNNVLTFDMVKGTIHKLLVLNNKECLMWLQHQRAREKRFVSYL